MLPACHPLELSAILHHKAHSKQELEELKPKITDYFSNLNQSKEIKTSYIDRLTAVLTIIEVFSKDPIYDLMQFGIVVFNECVFLNEVHLAQFINIDVLELKNGEELQCIIGFPQNAKMRLLHLGFLDSIDYNAYLIPTFTSLSGFIMKYKAIVQPFPLELYEILEEARNEAIESKKAAIEAIIELRRQMKGTKDMYGLSESETNE